MMHGYEPVGLGGWFQNFIFVAHAVQSSPYSHIATLFQSPDSLADSFIGQAAGFYQRPQAVWLPVVAQFLNPYQYNAVNSVHCTSAN
jgi:uncharacterized membrane protein